MARFTSEGYNGTPLKVCLACGGNWFRTADYYEFLREPFGGLWNIGRPLVGQSSQIPMMIAVCLCGTPQVPRISGVPAGDTRKREMNCLRDSLQEARNALDGSALWPQAEQQLEVPETLNALTERLHALERIMARQLASKNRRRQSPRGRYRLSS